MKRYKIQLWDTKIRNWDTKIEWTGIPKGYCFRFVILTPDADVEGVKGVLFPVYSLYLSLLLLIKPSKSRVMSGDLGVNVFGTKDRQALIQVVGLRVREGPDR